MNSLYSLRFFAFIAIYIHHLYYPYGFGSISVTFFFVISGFMMANSLNKKSFNINKKYLRDFYLSKFIKLYPLHILTFIVSIPLMYYLNANYNILNIIENVFLIQSYFPNGDDVFLFNGLSWFIADIMFFYLITPFLFYLFKRLKINKNIKMLTLLILIFYLVAFFISYNYKWNVAAYTFGWWLIYISPFFRIFDYIIGFLLGFMFINLKDYKFKKLNIDLLLFSILEIITIMFMYLSYKSKFFLIDSLRYGVYYIPAIAFIIFIFAYGRGIISKIISVKLFVYLGEISNVIYMIHQVIMYYTAIFLGGSIYYCDCMSLKNYLTQIYLLFIILCISDVVNRYFIPFINKVFTIKSNNKSQSC